MKLSPAQREVLGQLRNSGPQTAAMLGARRDTLQILRRWGCVELAPYSAYAHKSEDGVFWRITDKGRQEAAA